MNTNKIWLYLPLYMRTGMNFLLLFQVKEYLGDESRGPYRSTYCETYVLDAKREGISMQVQSRTKYLFHEWVIKNNFKAHHQCGHFFSWSIWRWLYFMLDVMYVCSPVGFLFLLVFQLKRLTTIWVSSVARIKRRSATYPSLGGPATFWVLK